jgi:nucleoside-diphosphate-sugar epimerase
MYVEDVCRAINHLMIHGEENSIYNIGSGDKIKFIEIINKIIEVTKSSSEIKNIEPPEFHRIVQVKDMLLDICKLSSTNFAKGKSILDNLDKIL